MNRHIDAVTPVAAHQHRRVPAGIQAFHHSHGNFLSVGRNDRPKRRLQLVLPRDAHRQRTMAHEFCDICANVVKIGVAAQGRRAKCEGDGGTAGAPGMGWREKEYGVCADLEIAEMGDGKRLFGDAEMMIGSVQLERADAIAVATLLVEKNVFLGNKESGEVPP